MGNFTSQLPTMFWILNSMNRACRHRQTDRHIGSSNCIPPPREAGEVEGGGGGREGEGERGGERGREGEGERGRLTGKPSF